VCSDAFQECASAFCTGRATARCRLVPMRRRLASMASRRRIRALVGIWDFLRFRERSQLLGASHRVGLECPTGHMQCGWPGGPTAMKPSSAVRLQGPHTPRAVRLGRSAASVEASPATSSATSAAMRRLKVGGSTTPVLKLRRSLLPGDQVIRACDHMHRESLGGRSVGPVATGATTSHLRLEQPSS
jgi:hypothetical protein